MKSEHPPVGAFLNKTNCCFRVWAPLKESMTVVIEKNNSEHAMTKSAFGYWETTVEGIGQNDGYFFRIEGGSRLPDPASYSQLQGVHGASNVADRNFSWTDSGWKGLAAEDMIQYELHTGTFSEHGTFDGIAGKLDYLLKLGVNAIEIMPIAQFPGVRNWGYDGVFPGAAQNSYGGHEGLKRLINQAHAKGIAVILDVVYNHLGPEGNYFEKFAPYFTDNYKTGWGSAVNFDGPFSDGVRNFYLRNAAQWLEEFHADGLRLDAVHAIYDNGAHHFIQELQELTDEIQTRTGVIKTLIAEIDLNNPRYINRVANGGYGLAAQWTDEFHHALHSLVTGEREGYYEDFGEPEQLSKSLNDSYVYTGQYSQHRKKYFGVLPEENPYSQFVVFSQNHDQIGNRMKGDRLSELISFDQQKLCAAAVLLAPQIPLLFMGEEYGEKNPFQYFADHSDKELLNAVREGRKKEFSHFNWQGEVPDPFAEKTFQTCRLSWALQSASGTSLFRYYQKLIALRKTHKAFQNKERGSLSTIKTESSKLIGFERHAGSHSVVVLLNFYTTERFYSNSDLCGLYKILDSNSTEFGGKTESVPYDVRPGQSISIPPNSVIVFELI